MFLFLFLQLSKSVQFCVTDVALTVCDCGTYPQISTSVFNVAFIQNEPIVDLFFCSAYTNILEVTTANTQFILNSPSLFDLSVNLSNANQQATYQLTNMRLDVSLTTTLDTIYANSFTMSNSQVHTNGTQLKLKLSTAFSGSFNEYNSFSAVYAPQTTFLNFDQSTLTTNAVVNLPETSTPQSLIIQYIQSCTVTLSNNSALFTYSGGSTTLTVNSQNLNNIDLYVQGTSYTITSGSTLFSSLFIPINIYNYFPTTDTTQRTLTLNYNGFFATNIASSKIMQIGEFPTNIAVQVHIQRQYIPLDVVLYQNVSLFVDSDGNSILGSLYLVVPETNISTTSLTQITFGVGSVMRFPTSTTGTLRMNPLIRLAIEKYNDSSLILDYHELITYGDFVSTPGFNYPIELFNNTDLHFNVSMGMNGLEYPYVEGPITQGLGSKIISVSFDQSCNNNVYFYRSVVDNPMYLYCNKYSFDCNEWNVNIDPIDNMDFTMQCGRNAKSLQCISIQATSIPNVEKTQEIFIGNNVYQYHHNSLYTSEAATITNLNNLIDSTSNIFILHVGVDTTIDLSVFGTGATVIINGTNYLPTINLMISDTTASITRSVNYLAIIDCIITITGNALDAPTFVMHNCTFPDLTTISLNSQSIAIPFSIYSTLPNKVYNNITLFDISTNITVNFTNTNLVFNGLQIQYSDYNYLAIYPLLTSALGSVTVSYSIGLDVTSVKGFELNFDQYNLNGLHFLERTPFIAMSTFQFEGPWENVTSIQSTFALGLNGASFVINDFPVNINLISIGGSIIYNGLEAVPFQNEVYIGGTTFLTFTEVNATFDFTTLRAVGTSDLSSFKFFNIGTLILDESASLSGNQGDFDIATINMGKNSVFSSLSLNADVINMNFDLAQFPVLRSSNLGNITSIVLNYLNDTRDDPSLYIGETHNILCSPDLMCQEEMQKITISSSIGDVANNYAFGCTTTPDVNDDLCLYAYLSNTPTLYTPPAPPSSGTPGWVIAISIVIPLIVIGAVAAILLVLYFKKKRSNTKGFDNGSPDASPTRRRIQPPIPPRRKDRPSPRAQTFLDDNLTTLSQATEPQHARTTFEINVGQKKQQNGPSTPIIRRNPTIQQNSLRMSPYLKDEDLNKSRPNDSLLPKNKTVIEPKMAPNSQDKQQNPPSVKAPVLYDDQYSYAYEYYSDEPDV